MNRQIEILLILDYWKKNEKRFFICILRFQSNAFAKQELTV